MKKIILREFKSGAGIISPCGHVYKDSFLPNVVYYIDYIQDDIALIVATVLVYSKDKFVWN